MLKELYEKRAKAVKDARAILDLAKTEKRAMTDDESQQYDKLFKSVDEIRQTIEREERQREAERGIEEALGEAEERAAANGADHGERRENADALMATFRNWVSNGVISGNGTDEFRALSADVALEGGYTVVPEVFVTSLIKAIDDQTIVRGLANVISQFSGASIGVPSLDADPEDGDWTTELSTGTTDSAMAFGKRVMTPHPLAKRILVSETLLRTSALPVEAIVRMAFARKFGITQEKAYLTGNGDKRPLGMFTASAGGISTTRDISSENTTTKPSTNGLINAKYSLKAGYWANANWIFHRDVVKEIAKLKDSNGQYLWRESMQVNEPDRLLGRPVYMSEFAPNTLTTGQYIGMLGDFSYYWVLDSMAFQMKRLVELFAATNQIGFFGRYEGDGAPVLEEAFARVTLA